MTTKEVYITELLDHNKNPMSEKIFEIALRKASRKSSAYDEYTIKFSYVEKVQKKFMIKFNNQDVQEYPPEIFPQDDENFLPDLNEMKSITHWDKNDHSAFVELLLDLYRQYQKYQVEKLNSNERMRREYELLMKNRCIGPSDIEVFCQNDNGPYVFHINLNVTTYVKAFTKDKSNNRFTAKLTVTFRGREPEKVQPDLLLSENLEDIIGGIRRLQIPPYSIRTSLADYVPVIIEALKTTLQNGVNQKRTKIEFFLQFREKYRESLIEMNDEVITVLLTWNDFMFTVQLKLPLSFPVDSPACYLKSIFHRNKDVKSIYSKKIEQYPHSPRWSAQEMLSRFHSAVIENVPSFKEESVKRGQFM
ncbi:unnamed protein product [Dimorphilus gyrociliatus]|uniref:BRISC and BRCA1-A complex member 2 n=1 Tax=Dimorphilus gyrociliatus TaxID=2664684 RepID=A0A7I8V8N3_9ANNE|nr:unnamed protein product [Dimorphilus gyrociliatus]